VLVDRLRDHHDFELDVHQTALVGRCNLHTRHARPAGRGANPRLGPECAR
jgi:hypothetical protein